MTARYKIFLKAITQLGFFENLNHLYYQIGLFSGLFKIQTPVESKNSKHADTFLKAAPFNFWPDPSKLLNTKSALGTIDQAKNILDGKFHLFGMTDAKIDLSPKSDLSHWSNKIHSLGNTEPFDIKFIWEPARFGWALKLAQAYYLTREEKYAQKFLELLMDFIDRNPLNLGPNWESAQEVALRLIALIIACDLMRGAKSFTSKRKEVLLRSIADHADRVPPTLSYAKAQNNNHLISEAVGLFTAGVFLPDHPHSKKWRHLGLKWFNKAIQRQIAANGEYIQHSTNYHRMMLMLSLWMNALLLGQGSELDQSIKEKLSCAVTWLYTHYDQLSGKVSNLGHNDGAHILPFSSSPYDDFRPILSAASRAFSGKPILEPGEWDDLSSWLGIPSIDHSAASSPESGYRIGNKSSWASLRAVKYKSRPAHADQLQVDLWYQGYNIARDPGTYQYNAPPPWDNGLARSCVHNTITINGKDQMLRAGRFLWLDWSQGKLLTKNRGTLSAEHDGYQFLNVIHRREVKNNSEKEWEISDFLLPQKPTQMKIRAAIHWLLPDFPFEIKNQIFSFSAPFGVFRLQISPEPKSPNGTFQIFHKGITIFGPSEENALLGWYSPSYGVKNPACSIVYSIQQNLPIKISSFFTFS
jgi:hypothetical protein